jgi:hypothetical protein
MGVEGSVRPPTLKTAGSMLARRGDYDSLRRRSADRSASRLTPDLSRQRSSAPRRLCTRKQWINITTTPLCLFALKLFIKVGKSASRGRVRKVGVQIRGTTHARAGSFIRYSSTELLSFALGEILLVRMMASVGEL